MRYGELGVKEGGGRSWPSLQEMHVKAWQSQDEWLLMQPKTNWDVANEKFDEVFSTSYDNIFRSCKIVPQRGSAKFTLRTDHYRMALKFIHQALVLYAREETAHIVTVLVDWQRIDEQAREGKAAWITLEMFWADGV